MDADHTALLYQTQVRWLSKRSMLSRIFELREEVKLFLVAKQKHNLLLAFGGDGFSTYLADLAGIFEALNQLNKKLQGPGTNIIVHSDAINAFVVKLNLWRQRAKNNNFASFHRLTEITSRDVAAAPQTPQLGGGPGQLWGPRPTLGAQVSLKLLFGYVIIFSSADLFTTNLNCRRKLACDIISECYVILSRRILNIRLT